MRSGAEEESRSRCVLKEGACSVDQSMKGHWIPSMSRAQEASPLERRFNQRSDRKLRVIRLCDLYGGVLEGGILRGGSTR